MLLPGAVQPSAGWWLVGRWTLRNPPRAFAPLLALRHSLLPSRLPSWPLNQVFVVRLLQNTGRYGDAVMTRQCLAVSQGLQMRLRFVNINF